MVPCNFLTKEVLYSIKFFRFVSREKRIDLFKGISCSFRAVVVFLIISGMASHSC